MGLKRELMKLGRENEFYNFDFGMYKNYYIVIVK